jgi:hypothetical protein
VDFVADASVSLMWYFEDQVTPYGETVLDQFLESRAIIPGIWLLEIANALVVGERTVRSNVQ